MPDEEKAVARAMWKGVIRFGKVALPVKLYSGVQERGVRFRLLHERDRVPLQQRMVNPETGRVVPFERIRKGFEAEDAFVLLDDEELEELEPKPGREIEITRFLKQGVLTQQWYDRPYFLGPDGDGPGYFALAEALRRQGKEGIARWVMRKTEYQGSLRAEGDYLMLITLRHAEEVIPASALPAPGGRALAEPEVAMARQLVGALEDVFDPAAYRDEYRERVLELVRAKAAGRRLPPRRVERKPAAPSLTKALQASLRAARKERKRAA